MFSKTVRRGSGTPTAKVLLWPILHENYIKNEKNGSRGKGNSSLASRLDYLVLSEDGPLYITLWFTSVTPCCDIGQIDIFFRIGLFPLSSLSSDNTNCKNDIPLFHQLFDELSVYRDYH